MVPLIKTLLEEKLKIYCMVETMKVKCQVTNQGMLCNEIHWKVTRYISFFQNLHFTEKEALKKALQWIL